MQKTWMIGELAELLGVSRDTLRIYEEQGLLKPMRDENGFRVYSEENICRLVGIRFYRESLLPIKSVRQLMEDLPAEEKLSLLEKQIEEEKPQASGLQVPLYDGGQSRALPFGGRHPQPSGLWKESGA